MPTLLEDVLLEIKARQAKLDKLVELQAKISGGSMNIALCHKYIALRDLSETLEPHSNLDIGAYIGIFYKLHKGKSDVLVVGKILGPAELFEPYEPIENSVFGIADANLWFVCVDYTKYHMTHDGPIEIFTSDSTRRYAIRPKDTILAGEELNTALKRYSSSMERISNMYALAVRSGICAPEIARQQRFVQKLMGRV